MHDENPITDAILDSSGLTIALSASLLMLLVIFPSIAPDLPTQIGMGGLSFVVAFFGVRGWLSKHKLGKFLWVVFMLVEVFSHTSFGMIATGMAAQVAQASTKEDPELVRLKERASTLAKTATDLADKVAGLSEGFKSEVDVRQKGVKEANDAASKASADVTAYLSGNKETKRAMFDADRFFTAIPDALTSGNPSRWIAFFFFVMIFAGMQITVVIAAEGVLGMIERKRSIEKEEEVKIPDTEPIVRTGRTPGIRREIPKKTVIAWVNATWSDHTLGVSDLAVRMAESVNLLASQGVKLTKNWDNKLYGTAMRIGLVNLDGKLTVPVIEARKRMDEAMRQ